MAEHRLPPPPAPVAAPIVEHAAVEPPPVVDEPPAVDPVLAPPPAPVLVADPATAVKTVEEIIFLAILLVLSQIYVFYRVLPAACIFSAYVCPRFIYIFFLGSFVWVYSGKPVYSFEAIVFMLRIVFRAFVSSYFCMPPWPSIAFFSFRNLGFLVLFSATIVRVFPRLPVWVNLR